MMSRERSLVNSTGNREFVNSQIINPSIANRQSRGGNYLASGGGSM
jgi:hypothetical protein